VDACAFRCVIVDKEQNEKKRYSLDNRVYFYQRRHIARCLEPIVRIIANHKSFLVNYKEPHVNAKILYEKSIFTVT
jgi:hypothetical protein